jgi:hypothetical protein
MVLFIEERHAIAVCVPMFLCICIYMHACMHTYMVRSLQAVLGKLLKGPTSINTFMKWKKKRKRSVGS